MAVGSNTLGLLIKVAIDAAVAGAKKELDDFFKSTKAGAESSSTAFKTTTDATKQLDQSTKQLGITFNQVRIAIGQVVGGLTLAKAFREISQSIQEIGTRSKEDFDTLQKQVEAAGGHITELQRNISQELVGAFDRLKGASAGFMAEVIEKSGPALINLLKDIADWLVRLKPLADDVGANFADTFNRLNAIGRTIDELRQKAQQPSVGDVLLRSIFPGYALKQSLESITTFDNTYAAHLKKVTDENEKFVAKQAGTDPDKTKKARKDITDAALEQAKAENALTLVRQDAAIADKQINEDQAKGLITQEEGARRRIAVLAELQKAETAVLDARKKAVETDPTLLANQRAKQLNDIETQRTVLRTQAAEAQREEDNKTITADQKLHDAFAAHFAKLKQEWLTYAEFIHDRTDEIVADLARQAQPVPGGAGQGPIPGAPPEIPLPKPLGGFFDDLQKSLGQSMDSFSTWGDLAGKVLGQFAQATEQAFAGFILTGKLSGQIFKQLVAQIIASLAIEGVVKGVFELAEAAADAANLNFYGAAMHTAAAHTYFAVAAIAGAVGLGIGLAGGLGGGAAAGAAAGGGGFGGSTEAPGTVTVNQGSPGMLGIQLLSDIHSMLSTASPGDVVTRGAEQNPVAIGQANNEASRRDGSISREFLQISGLRTA